LVAVGLLFSGASSPVHVQAPTGFASRVAQLSERGGYFDTDNLISNEKSYLHVIPALHEAGVTGGAYIGVGPDQNFSYIAQVRPTIAFIIDIRRDNLLLHLLFKALFTMSEMRVDYLSLLFGASPPVASEDWRKANLDRLIAYIEAAKPTAASTTALRRRVDATIRTFGVPLTAADYATIDRFHRTFIDAGLPLKFETAGRQPRGYYPTYRELLVETDRQGHRWNFLAAEDDYQYVRSLERRDLIIPVVGDLGGPTAVAAIAKVMTERGDRLSAFYASNVEFYLFNDSKWDRFMANLARVPHTSKSVLIRSVFGGYVLPQSVSGYYSTSLTQPIDDVLQGFTSGKYRSYNDLMLLSR
jgi:hypothetical protein